MVNTAHIFKSGLKSSVLKFTVVLSGCAFVLLSSVAKAQSSAAFATMPYQAPVTQQAAPRPAQALTAQASSTPARYRGPSPVTMFRAKPAAQQEPVIAVPEMVPAAPTIEYVAPMPAAAAPDQRTYSIAHQAQRDALQTGWDRASLEPVIAPPLVTGTPSRRRGATFFGNRQSAPPGPPPPRGPVRRILQDTGRGLAHDLPEAVADALPWVDRDAKNEPFDEVLDRVAEDLNRAARADPAWALPAQREIRALSQRFNTLSAPPPLTQAFDDTRPAAGLASADDRPFRPRPIWPGAAGRPEAQVRPVTLVTVAEQQAGPRVSGVATRYIPAAEDDDGNPAPATSARRPARAKRGPVQARPSRSR